MGKTMYVRIKTPKSSNQDIPQSITCKGVKFVQGGPGVKVQSNSGIIGRLKNLAGEHNVEVSKKPFEVVAPKGGVIDLDNMKMTEPADEGKKEPEGEGTEGDDE